MILRWWAEPAAGEIVWCHFPDDIHPRPKPRPALVLAVFDDDAPQFTVRVAYGTSQRTTRLHRGEFSILHERNPAAYAAAGLSYDTKFDLKQVLDLPYNTESVLRCHPQRPMARRPSWACCIRPWSAPCRRRSGPLPSKPDRRRSRSLRARGVRERGSVRFRCTMSDVHVARRP